jgi:hypothetical protein
MLIMHPVLRVNATTIRFGAIRGTVSLATGVTLPACGGAPTTRNFFTPWALLGTDTIRAAVDTETGTYRIGSLLPDTYTMGFDANYTAFGNGDSLTFTATPSVASAVVAEADSVTVDYSITAATCH